MSSMIKLVVQRALRTLTRQELSLARTSAIKRSSGHVLTEMGLSHHSTLPFRCYEVHTSPLSNHTAENCTTEFVNYEQRGQKHNRTITGVTILVSFFLGVKSVICGKETDVDDSENPMKGLENISTPLRTAHQARTENRSLSKTNCSNSNVLKSLQRCKLEENLDILYRQEDRINDENRKQKLRGLQAVLLELLHADPDDVNKTPKASLPFQEAFDIFMGYQKCNESYNTRDWRVTFRDAILNPSTGLCVNIVTNPSTATRYVVLRPDNLDMTPIYDSILNPNAPTWQTKQMEFTEVKEMISTMSSDWDKNCLRYALVHDKSQEQARCLGISKEQVTKVKSLVPSVVDAISMSKPAATDLVNLRLRDKRAKIEKRIDDNNALLVRKKGHWPERKIKDIEADLELDMLRLSDIVKLQKHEDRTEQRKYNQMVRRQLQALVKENRLGLRMLGNQGRPEMLDAEIEEAILKSVEDVASYHGRRHEATQYLNHRVKGRDLLYTANALLAEKGKSPIQSHITVWNRSRPRRKNTIQAKQHIGLGLWCTKKPPKAEENENELTHHQRAHINNVKMYFFSEKAGNMQKYVTMRSIDDKAYIRPGTGEAMDKSRNQRILTPVAEERAKKLPVHDWPERLVCVTPSTHRVFSKESKILNDKEKLFTKDDNHFVFVRPKHYIGSSGQCRK